MGFIYLGDALERQPQRRLYKESVGRIMTSCGITDPLTVESPTDQTIVACAAVNDALELIWMATTWEFRKKQIYFEMDDETGYYLLPEDYSQFTRDAIISPSRAAGLPYQPWDALLTEFPWIGEAHESVRRKDLSAGGVISSAFIENGGYGVPTRWSLNRGYLILFPFPREVDYDDRSDVSWGTDKHLLASYYASFRTLSSDTDEIPLPHELLPAMHFTALAYFKQAYEYPDFQADEQRGDRLLSIERAKAKRAIDDEWDGFTSRPGRLSSYGPGWFSA